MSDAWGFGGAEKARWGGWIGRGAAKTAAAIAAAGVLTIGASSAKADPRTFLFSYEATTMPAGTHEIENWATWKSRTEDDHSFNRFEFRHELEFGVTDRLQMSIYLSDWQYEHSHEDNGARWNGVATEVIYNLTSPVTDPIGIAVYGELKGGDEAIEAEGKVLLQKNIGPFVFVWNGVLEAEFEGDGYAEHNGTLEQTAGISYQVFPAFTVGVEAVHEAEYENWSEWGRNTVYVGPNAVYRGEGWWVGVAPLMQVTSVDDEPQFVTRMAVGIDF